MQSNFCKVPKGCLWVKHANEDQSKVSQRFQVCPELVDMIKVPLFFKSQLKIDATFDQNDEIRTLRLGFCSKIFLVKTFDRD